MDLRKNAPRRALIGYHQQRKMQRVAALLILLAIVAMVLLPAYWMAISSLKPSSEMYASPPTLWPRNPTLASFAKLFRKAGFARQLANSFVIASTVTMLSVALASAGGYALTRLRFLGRDVVSAGIFFVYLVPTALLLIPMFLLVVRLRLLDTYASLVLAHLTFALPFCAWMLKGYLQTIPVDVEEAALLDGASRLQALRYVVLPLALPGVVASAVFTFTLSWDDFIFALVFIRTLALTTAPVGLATLATKDVLAWDQLNAGALIMAAPVVILYMLAQRYVVTGLTAGAVKG
jgi:multiple sugar transport system permease protein